MSKKRGEGEGPIPGSRDEQDSVFGFPAWPAVRPGRVATGGCLVPRGRGPAAGASLWRRLPGGRLLWDAARLDGEATLSRMRPRDTGHLDLAGEGGLPPPRVELSAGGNSLPGGTARLGNAGLCLKPERSLAPGGGDCVSSEGAQGPLSPRDLLAGGEAESQGAQCEGWAGSVPTSPASGLPFCALARALLLPEGQL